MEAISNKATKVSFEKKFTYAMQQTATRPFKYIMDRNDIIKQNSLEAFKKGEIDMTPGTSMTTPTAQPLSRKPVRSIITGIKTK